MPTGTTVNGAAFGTAYGGQLSDWVDLGTNATETLTENVAPAITSGASATSIVGTPFSFTVTTTGEPTPALTESGALPAGPDVHRQRQRHRHHRWYPSGGHRRQLPDHDHGHQQPPAPRPRASR